MGELKCVSSMIKSHLAMTLNMLVDRVRQEG